MKNKPFQKGIHLLGHPLHPALTHFPIALLPVSLVGDFMSILFDNPFWPLFAFYCIAAGLIMALPTLVTGLVDYLALEDKHPAEKTAIWHMTATLAATALFTISLVLRSGSQALSGFSLYIAIGLSGIGAVLLFIGGWLGGELVFAYRVGIDHSSLDNTKEKTVKQI